MLCTVVRSRNRRNLIFRTVRFIFALAIVDSPNHSWFHWEEYFVKLAIYTMVWTSSHSLLTPGWPDIRLARARSLITSRWPRPDIPAVHYIWLPATTPYQSSGLLSVAMAVSKSLVSLVLLNIKIRWNFHILIWMIFWLICLYRG